MDLGKCPRCGLAWIRGTDRCRGCPYVAIGAGIQAKPQKRRRPVRYREGGGCAPALFFLSLVVAGAYGAIHRPWQDGFSGLKSMIGLPVPPRPDGQWVVTKVFAGGKSTMAQECENVVIGFTDGTVTLRGRIGSGGYDAKGPYTVLDGKIAVGAWRGEGADRIPKPFRAGFEDLGGGEALLTLADKTTMYLKRTEGRDATARALAYRLGQAGEVERMGQ